MRAEHTVAIVLIVAAVLMITAVNAETSDFFEYKIVWNCKEAGLKDCDLLVGPAYEYTINKSEGDAPSFVVFPHEGYLTRKDIDCANIEAVVIARYDLRSESWIPIESEVIQENDGIKLKAPISSAGIYAVVKKTAKIGFEDNLCVPLSCGEAGGYVSVPYSGKVKENDKIVLEFCGMIEGCQATADGECSRACPEGIDPDCAGIKCTSEGGDCCDINLDGICDPDCFVDYEHNNFGQDPDCMFSEQSGADMLGETEEAVTDDVKINVEAKAGKSRWQRFSFPVNAIVEGPVKIVPNDDLWFKDFSYIDSTGKKHILKPVCNTFRGAEEGYTVYCGAPSGSKSLDTWMPDKDYDANPVDHCEGGSYCDYAKEIVVDYFTRYPTQWYQAGGEEKQFDFPPTYIKEFSGVAAKDDNVNKDSSFHIVYNFYPKSVSGKGFKAEDVIDPDGDGYPSQIDCHDNNSDIHPGAEEICNGYDDDCDSFTYDYSHPASYVPAHTVHFPTWRNSQFQMEDDGFIVVKYVEPNAYMEVRKADEHWKENNFSFVDFQTSYRWHGYPESERRGAREVLSFITGDGETNRDADNCYSCRFMRGKIMDDSDDTVFKWLWPQVIGMESEIKGLRYDSNFNKAKGPSVRWIRIYAYDGNEIYRAKVKGPVDFRDSVLNPYIDTGFSQEYGGVVIDGLKKYDQIRGAGWYGGEIIFDVYYYPKAFNKSNVDEGCIEAERKVHVCSIPEFNQQERKCYDGTEICSTASGKISGEQSNVKGLKLEDDVAACVINAKDIGRHDFWVWVCEEGKDCYQFLESSYEVCRSKEVCDKSMIQDADCDGVMNFDENGEPLDSDCVGRCSYNSCDVYKKQWCDKDGRWVKDGYCLVCGSRDSSCAKLCEGNESSCGGGCRQDACDLVNDVWCDKGVWTTKGYAEECSGKDAGIGGQCQEGACDADEQKTCWKGSWLDGKERFDAYCRKCADYDSLCENKEQCHDGGCDIKNNKYCDNGKWSGENYCNMCGAIDSDCGVKECEDGACDSAAGKWCDNGVWKSDGYCDLAICGTDEKRCKCTEEVEVSCVDGLDNDCDGLVDCSDSDCPKDSCRCVEGSEIECGTSLGECIQGVRKCVNGRYGECEGAVMPGREVCDGLDNDCDGSVDEDCGGCRPGDTRPCGVDRGVCNAGIQKCRDDGRWSVCFGEGYNTASEEVCDGIDNDCDGQIDESCACKPGENRTCGEDKGECTLGVMTCNDDYTWGKCSGKQPFPEVCGDGLDNDCDGLVDGKDDDCTLSEGVESEVERQNVENPLESGEVQEGCSTDYDCGAGEECKDGTCVAVSEQEEGSCEEDGDCLVGEICEDGQCIEGCRIDDECNEGEVCEENACVEKKGLPWFYIIAAVILSAAVVLYFVFNKLKSKGKGKINAKGFGNGKMGGALQPYKSSFGKYQQQSSAKTEGGAGVAGAGRKIKKTKEEEMLEKSLRESANLFGSRRKK